MIEEKKKALSAALTDIEKQFGKGAVMRLDAEGRCADRPDTGVIPSGSTSVDVALGIGGYPRGRIIEIYGPESSGKTTLTLHAVAEAQRLGGIAAFIDAEHALDTGYAKRLGVKTDELLVSQPDHGEQALEIADALVRSNAVDIIVIDSVAALVPKAEIEGDMGDQLPGLQARLMSQALRKLTAAVHRSNALVIFINQIRMKIGVMFGNPETTTGGNALKFYSSVRIDVRRVGAIKAAAGKGEDEMAIGNRTKVRIVKNKMAAPFREVEFDILYGQGISKTGDLVDLAEEGGLIQKSGSWYTYAGERMQGREAAKAYFDGNAAAFAKLQAELLAKHGIKRSANDNAQEVAAEKPAKRAHA